VSPDGQWVYFATRDPARYFRGVTWKVPVAGGEPVRVTETGLQPLALSPDGRILIGNLFDDGAQRMRLAMLPLAGSEAIKLFPVGPRTVAWTPDGRLTYVETGNGVGNIWELPIHGGPPRQLTHFEADRIIAFAWSPDGRKLAVARGRMISEVVTITDSRKY
jgi:Tol biopolymer transport system component